MGFLVGGLSPFQTKAAMPFPLRDRRGEDVVTVGSNSTIGTIGTIGTTATTGTGTLNIVTEDSPATPLDFSAASNARVISFASLAAQGLHESPSTSRQVATAVARQLTASTDQHPSLHKVPSSSHSLSRGLCLPSIASGTLPAAAASSAAATAVDALRAGSIQSAFASGPIATASLADSAAGCRTFRLNSGGASGPLTLADQGDSPQPANRSSSGGSDWGTRSPPSLMPPPSAFQEGFSAKLFLLPQQTSGGVADAIRLKNQLPAEEGRAAPPLLQLPALPTLPHMPALQLDPPLSDALRGQMLQMPDASRASPRRGGSVEFDYRCGGGGGNGGNSGTLANSGALPLHHPNPADKFLRFSELETCWAELRDLSFVGSGASGFVYSGMWCGMPVAVKFMLSGDTGQLARQQREAALSRLASHPHLVQTYAVAAAQLTPRHFQTDPALRRLSGLSHTDLLSTYAAGAMPADLYGTSNLSPAPSTAAADMSGRGGFSPSPSLMRSGPGPQPGTYESGCGGTDGAISPTISAEQVHVCAVGSPAAVLQHQQQRPASPGQALLRQQLRNRLSGNILAAGGASVCSTPNAVNDDAAGGQGTIQGAIGGSAGDGSGGGSISCSDRGLAMSTAGAPAAPSPPYQPVAQPRRGPADRPGRNHPSGNNVASTPGPTVTATAAIATAGGLSASPALATSISTVDIDVSGTYQVDAKADSFDMAASGPNGLMLFQPSDVMAHIGARPGQWLTVVIMEEMDRGSLHRTIHGGVFHPKTSPLTKRHRIRGMVRTLVEVAQGMAHLHSAGLVHGDLKPANVLLKANAKDVRGFVAKVSDFGVTRALAEGASQATVSTSDWGTVIYTAPEVFNGKAGMPSDVFSFGALIWHLTTGQLPHEDLNPFAVMLAVSKGELSLDWPPSVPRPLRKLGQLCMQHDPANRPSFAALARALRKLDAKMRMCSTSSSIPGVGPAAAGGSSGGYSMSLPCTPSAAGAAAVPARRGAFAPPPAVYSLDLPSADDNCI